MIADMVLSFAIVWRTIGWAGFQYRVQKTQRERALQLGLPRDPFCLLAHSSGSLTIFDARRSPSLFGAAGLPRD